MFNMTAKVGISTIEKTEFFVEYIGNFSLGQKENTSFPELVFWRNLEHSSFDDIRVGFTIFFTDSFYTNGSYKIRLAGQSIISDRIVSINVGYIF